jgi:NADH-quinone oxidoreductase subunit E
MNVIEVDTKRTKTVVNEALANHGTDVDELIPVLLEINEKLGYLSTYTIAELSTLMKLPLSRIYSVASFYKLLSIEPRGKHVIRFCESAPCHVMGGNKVLETLKEKLQINAGETTKDGLWTLVLTSCLGTCGVGPVMIIDDQIFGNVTKSSLTDVLAQIERGER